MHFGYNINMKTLEHINTNFKGCIDTITSAAETLTEDVAKAAEILVLALHSKHKILACGNGGSASQAMHFVAELVNRFKIERPGLPAIALNVDMATITAIANDYSYEEVFSRQVMALSSPGDILLVFSTSGDSQNVVNAVYEAHTSDMKVIALTGGDGGELTQALNENDLELRAPSFNTPRIQELHLLLLHCLCELIEENLFPFGGNQSAGTIN